MQDQANGVQNAFFVIADISGYTKFMTETEITHAKGVLEKLFDAVIPRIRPPFLVAGLHGDAVFAYALDSEVMRKQFIIDFAEQLYCAFALCKEKMQLNTSCRCDACSRMGMLELKVIVHHGRCVLQESQGRTELAGPDVITAFRLLKNSVTQRTGLNAYALITCEAAREMQLEGLFRDTDKHSETFEHIGEVEYVICDLHKAWAERRKSEHCFVAPDEPLLLEEWIIPVPVSPSVAFTVCTRPDLRAVWLEADGIDLTGTRDGRMAEGTLYHCHHGKETFLYEVADWRPGEYATVVYQLPMGLRIRETAEFLSMGEGTLIKLRLAKAEGGGFMGKLMRGMVNRKVRSMIEPARDRRIQLLTDVCEQQLAKAASLRDAAPPDPDALGLGQALDTRLSA